MTLITTLQLYHHNINLFYYSANCMFNSYTDEKNNITMFDILNCLSFKFQKQRSLRRMCKNIVQKLYWPNIVEETYLLATRHRLNSY